MGRRLRSASSEADRFEADPYDPGDDRFAADDLGSVASAPEPDPVERARALAWRSLNRRDRTVTELGAMLLGKRVEPAIADQVVTELLELGYLDDAVYAERFAADRRRLDGWGSERIARRLRELGVDRELIDAAVAAQDPEEEMAAALELLRRRGAGSVGVTGGRTQVCARRAAVLRSGGSDRPGPRAVKHQQKDAFQRETKAASRDGRPTCDPEAPSPRPLPSTETRLAAI